MADIFEEVEEGLRQDRAERLWKKYGVFAYIAAALLIGGVAANEYLQHRTTQSAEQNAQAFETARNALADQEFQSAAEGFEALADSDARIAPLAANFLAEARMQGNADRSAAIAALEQAGVAGHDADTFTDALAHGAQDASAGHIVDLAVAVVVVAVADLG